MFSDNALKVLQKRYFLKDDKGRLVEDVAALFTRVAGALAASERRFGGEEAVEKYSRIFFDLMINRRFMPNSPTLMNAGKNGGQLSACFVLPVPDNLEGIFETCKNAALIHKTGGGTGFSFSRIRPANDRVASSTGVASGPISFMTVYDAATEAIRQGGTRRGANMGILRIDHPDIEEFISCKRDTDKLNNFNISVAVTDTFMQAVREDSDFELIHPSYFEAERKNGASAIDRSLYVVRTVSARDLFRRIVENAHATGEPGLVFIDRINESDPVFLTFDSDGRPVAGTEDIEATNPCGEQPLGPGDACNLGSINVAAFVDESGTDFDYDALGSVVDHCVRFLDDVIDANCYPFEFVRAATLNNRRIGLGIMGFAEALIRMGLPYDSEAAVDRGEQLMRFIDERAAQASAALADERGNFPNWPFSIWGARQQKRRNATVTTIAPTGTISIIAGTTSGIEPLFAISFVRRVMGGTELIEVNPLFEEQAKERGFYSEALMRKIAQLGTVHDIPEVPEDIRRLWVCAHDIDYVWHIKMQAAFQRHTDNAVSKTINFPAAATETQVEQSFLAAYEQGLKGITVYRDTSRRSQVLNLRHTDPLKKAAGLPTREHHIEEAEPGKKTVSVGLKGTVTSPQSESVRISMVACEVTSLESGPEVSQNQSVVAPAVATLTVSTVLHRSNVYAKVDLCPQCGIAESFLKYEACRLCSSCGYTRC